MMVYRKMWRSRLVLITTLAGVASSADTLAAQGVDYAKPPIASARSTRSWSAAACTRSG